MTNTERIANEFYDRHMNKCPECGCILDRWDCCPQVSPEDARIGIKTCAPQQHPVACSCASCIERRNLTAEILELGNAQS